MRKQKDIYSKVFSEFVFSDEQIELLHKTLFDMLMDIKRVCEKHDITFLLSGGSMLGAVRHKGFIPWDDDLDIMMLRSEYVKFRQAVLSEMTDKYDLVEPLDGKYTNKKPKLFLKNCISVCKIVKIVLAFNFYDIEFFMYQSINLILIIKISFISIITYKLFDVTNELSLIPISLKEDIIKYNNL